MNSDSFSALPGSIHLDLSSNQLNGSISKFISEMQSIKYLNLANNTLHGVVPFNLTFVKGFGSIQTWLNRSAGFCSRNGHPETISAQPLVASGSEESLEKKLKDGPKRCSNCNKRFGLTRFICLCVNLCYFFFLCFTSLLRQTWLSI